jgi:alpha-N-acetylglucosamine transferase
MARLTAGAPVLDRAPGSAEAYVTLVTNADYLPGARVLVRSLRLTGTAADVVAMHTPAVPADALAPLTALGARLACADLPPTSDAFNEAHSRRVVHDRAPFTKGEKPAFHTPLDNFVKLRLWQLPYARAVFLDADTLVLRDIDRLFSYPEYSAAPNVYESLANFRRLNSGVFTARPHPTPSPPCSPASTRRAPSGGAPTRRSWRPSSRAGTACRSTTTSCNTSGSTCRSFGTGAW